MNNLAEICEIRGQTQQAIDHRLAAIKVAPKASNYVALAEFYARLNRITLAQTTFAQAAAIAPRDASILADWAMALFEAERSDDALKKAREAHALDPNSAYAMYVLGTCLQSTARTPEASREPIQLFRDAIKARPDYWRPYIRLAEMLNDPKDAAEAKALRTRGAELRAKNDPD